MARLLNEIRRQRFALLLVVLCGVVLSFFLAKTFVDPGPRQYALDFGYSCWLEPPTPSPAGYFRATLYAEKPVERGWIELAATDHFLLYVNGVLVNETFFGAERVTGIFDIRNLLTQGKNVIAIYVPRIFAPGSSQLRARGYFSVAGGRSQEFLSDASWKASNTPDGVVQSYQWYDRALDDSGWKSARPVEAGEQISTVQAVSVPPRLFASDPTAEWISPRDLSTTSASFEGDFDLPSPPGDTALQIASTGAYDVFVNGHYVIAQPAPQRTTLTFAQPSAGGPAGLASNQIPGLAANNIAAAQQVLPLQVATVPAVPTLLFYDLSRWVRGGANRIQVRVRADNVPPLLLAEISSELPGGKVQLRETDQTWRVVSPNGSEPARPLGRNGVAPWGFLPQAPAQPTITPAADLVKYLPWAAVMTGCTLALLLLWVLFARIYAEAFGLSLGRGLAIDALLHGPVLAYLLICWLLTFDIRFDQDWCFTPAWFLGAIGILAVGRALLFGASLLSPPTPCVRRPPTRRRGALARCAILCAFAAVALGGFCIRAWDLNGMSLGSDEVTMIMNADGVLHSGYPHSPRGTFDRLLATYELIPYSLALPSFVFGRTEFAYHLPALIFGSLTILLLGWVGLRLFGWRVGLVSSFIYAFFPPAIAWSRNGFYPAQEQFVSLLTFWCFYEAVRSGPFKPRYLTAAAAGFIVSYLSWEGSGFIVPALFVALIAIRWGDFSWVRDWHLWRCFIVMTALVLSQLSYRQLTLDSYLGVGYSLSDITAPTFVYRDLLVYNPWYYLNVLFFSETNFVLSLFIFLGFLFCWRQLAIRYVIVLLFTLELCYTNFLPFYAPRYCYNAEILLILGGVSIFFRFRDAMGRLGGRSMPAWFRAFRWTAAGAVTLWLLLATNEFAVPSYRLSASAENPALFARPGYYKTDHRAAAAYVRDHLRPGDAVIAFMPHMYQFYTGRPADYSINTFLNEKMTYDGGRKEPQFIDKFCGLPLIRSLDELKDIQGRYRRLWILVPIRNDNVALSPDTLTYLTRQASVAFESYREQVILLQGAPPHSAE